MMVVYLVINNKERADFSMTDVIPYDSHKEICPKCSHTRKTGNRSERCLTIWDNGYRKCHNCGDEGFQDKITKAPPAQKIYTKPSQELPEGLPKEVIDYFEKRGISYDVLMRNKISFDPHFQDIIFPYTYNGEILNKKYRKLNEKRFRQEKDARKSFYGTDDITGEDDIYIVEGEIDKLSFEMAGFLNVLSVPDGAPNETAKEMTKKFDFIKEWKHIFKPAKRIIIAVDSDGPGLKLQEELIERLGSDKCWVVLWPDDCKDANEVLMKHGIAGLMGSIDRVRALAIEGVVWPDDIINSLVRLHKEGMQGGKKTGWLRFDEYYTVKPGEMTIVTGIPSHGKSSWLTALLVNLAQREDWKFLLYSPENYPPERHLASIASIYTGKPFKAGPTERLTIDEVMTVNSWLQNHFCYLQPHDNGTNLKALIKAAISTTKRHGINGLILDPWNEIDHSRPSGVTETEHISQCLTSVRMFARIYKVHVWIVAHPTKLYKDPNKSDSTYPIATAYDISGSAHWANKADNVISIWRDPTNESLPVQGHVLKVRFREVGKPGVGYFKYDKMTERFSDTSEFGAVDVTQEKARIVRRMQGKDSIPGEQGKGWENMI